MVVTLQQVYNGVQNYADKEIACKAVGVNKFMAYFVIPSIPNKINELLNKYNAFLTPYFDSNGNIKLDELYNALKQAMQRTIQFEYAGIIFKENDIDMLYRYVCEA